MYSQLNSDFPIITRYISKPHMTAKPTLYTPSEAKAKLEKRREQIATPRPDSESTPPVAGATVHTCQNGDNAGKRYWAIKQNENGWYKSTFLGWIDEPVKTLKQQIDEQGVQLELLKASVKDLVKRVKKTEKDDSDGDLME